MTTNTLHFAHTSTLVHADGTDLEAQVVASFFLDDEGDNLIVDESGNYIVVLEPGSFPVAHVPATSTLLHA